MLSATPKAKTAKTVWAPKSAIFVALSFVFAVFVVTYLNSPAIQIVTLGTTTYGLEVARSEQARERGLGGRTTLAADHGMVFVFDRPQIACFWMKDTHIPLDMIWLDANKTVQKIQAYVQPESYPTTYCPDQNSRYVIELAAGQSEQAGIHVGDTLQLNL